MKTEGKKLDEVKMEEEREREGKTEGINGGGSERAHTSRSQSGVQTQTRVFFTLSHRWGI